ncbi:MAG: YfhO family protein [Clostridia bacterium]|nr:YfhO family protein [Clostridia bacterium]
MSETKRKNRFSGTADAICRSRFSPYLFSFLFAFLGMIAVFLLARDSLSFLYETKAAGWYGRLASLRRGGTLGALSEGEDLAFLAFSVNPMNRLLSFFPFSSRLAGVCLTNAIRCGLAAAAFAFFLKRRKTDGLTAVLFSVLYALSSYSFVSQLTGVSVDCLIVLPLMLAGVESIVSRRGFVLFSLSLAFCAVASFRTLFGFLFFSLLWLFAVRLSRPGVRGKAILFDLLLVLLAILPAALFSAPILLPSFDRLLLTFRDLSFTQNYNLIEFFGKMLPATYDGLAGNRFPYLFIGMLPLLLLPIYFLCKKIPVREKVVFGSLVFILYFTFSVSVLSAFWDLFRVPDGYSYTLAAVFPALFLAISARALDSVDRRSERALTAGALILAVLISVLQRMNLSYEAEEGVKVVWFSEINSVWVPLPFLALACAGILAVIRLREGRPVKLFSLLSILLIVVTTLDVAVSNAALAGVIAKKEGTDVSETEGNHAYASSYYNAYASGFSSVGVGDPLYRAEKFDAITPDDAAYLGFASASVLPPDLLRALGIEYAEDGTLKTVSSPLSLSLLGVRYVATHEPIETKAKEKIRLHPDKTEHDPTYDTPAVFPDSLASVYEPICRDEGSTVYENEFVLPVLFRAAAIPDGSVLSAVNSSPYSRINSIFRILCGDESLSLYAPVAIESFSNPYCVETDADAPGYVGYRRNSSTGTATLVYTVTPDRDGPLFCSFPTEYPLDYATVSVDGRALGGAYLWSETDPETGEPTDNATLYAASYFLGNFSAGDTVRVSLHFGAGNDGTTLLLPADLPFIYGIDRDAAARAVSLLTPEKAPRSYGDSLALKADGSAYAAVVSTLPEASARVKGGDGASFLGVFAAGNAKTPGAKAVLSPVLSDLSTYLTSLLGCLLFALLLCLESAAAMGAHIPFFSRAAGGTEDAE